MAILFYHIIHLLRQAQFCSEETIFDAFNASLVWETFSCYCAIIITLTINPSVLLCIILWLFECFQINLTTATPPSPHQRDLAVKLGLQFGYALKGADVEADPTAEQEETELELVIVGDCW